MVISSSPLGLPACQRELRSRIGARAIPASTSTIASRSVWQRLFTLSLISLPTFSTSSHTHTQTQVGDSDVVLSLASLAFYLSVYDLFGVMAIGGTIVMPDPQRESDPEHWLDLLEKEKVTVWNTAPPVMSMLLEWVNSSSVATARFERLSLRVVMLSGDFCPLWVPTKLKELLPIENNLEVSIIISKHCSSRSTLTPLALFLPLSPIPYRCTFLAERRKHRSGPITTERRKSAPSTLSLGARSLTAGHWPIRRFMY